MEMTARGGGVMVTRQRRIGIRAGRWKEDGDEGRVVGRVMVM